MAWFPEVRSCVDGLKQAGEIDFDGDTTDNGVSKLVFIILSGRCRGRA